MPRRAASIVPLTGVIAIVSAIAVAEAQAPAPAPALDVVLDRLGAYLLDYETKVLELAAEEEYDQWIRRRPSYGQELVEKRKLKSTYFLVRLPDGQAWFGFRDVSSVNGRVVGGREGQMSQLLAQRTADAYEEALAITRANARYNIGDVFRTINLPLQALQLLHPEFRNRVDFRVTGRARLEGQETVVIEFTEQTLPSLIGDGFGGDVRARGRVWVNPDTGAVLRTELGFHGTSTSYPKETLIRVDFQRDAKLQVLLPREMEETYGLAIEVVHGRASYRNYRRFETSARLVTSPR